MKKLATLLALALFCAAPVMAQNGLLFDHDDDDDDGNGRGRNNRPTLEQTERRDVRLNVNIPRYANITSTSVQEITFDELDPDDSDDETTMEQTEQMRITYQTNGTDGVVAVDIEADNASNYDDLTISAQASELNQIGMSESDEADIGSVAGRRTWSDQSDGSQTLIDGVTGAGASAAVSFTARLENEYALAGSRSFVATFTMAP